MQARLAEVAVGTVVGIGVAAAEGVAHGEGGLEFLLEHVSGADIETVTAQVVGIGLIVVHARISADIGNIAPVPQTVAGLAQRAHAEPVGRALLFRAVVSHDEVPA